MIETSAHLIDHVIPDVPVRQWVLSFPWPLRLLIASQPDALSRCLALVTRAIETDLIQRAGLTRASRARTGVVTLIQRFGSTMNLNVHLHMIVLDGMYTMARNQPRFHRVNAPARQNLDKLLNRIIARGMRRLIKDGLLIQDQEQPWLHFQEKAIVDTLNAASIRYRVASRPGAGSRTLTLKNPGLLSSDIQPKPFTVDRNGLSPNVAVACRPQQRERLERVERVERLCRYVTRPAVCLERLSTNAAGQMSYELNHPFHDGTTYIRLDKNILA